MTRTPLVTAGLLLGIGMGGFIDGILFHQVLQLHSLLSAKVSRTTLVGLETNMFWDGIFHLLTWLTTAAGLAMLWHVARRGDVRLSNATFLGSLGLGWGLFNLVEGVVDHHLLHLHHVVEGPNHLKYDLAFLASGLLLIVAGAALIRRDR
ncbi:MAG TPA: DUF2243 domain-containing protein [Lacipirellulaceae bacterium]|nr:DUF2243 domain-containing protein [Lacipirellulaceae bacterium]